MSTKILDPEIPVSKIVQIIRSGSPLADGVTRMRALIALGQSRSTRKAEVFSALFANRHELPRFRIMAVTALLELGGVAAERALLQCVPSADEFTAAALALALGRLIGRSGPRRRRLHGIDGRRGLRRLAIAGRRRRACRHPHGLHRLVPR